MYLSLLITTYDANSPGYEEIHVGLYITALQDAIKRARLKSARATTRSNGRRGENAKQSKDNVHKRRGDPKLKRRRTVRQDTQSEKMVGASSREVPVSRDHSISAPSSSIYSSWNCAHHSISYFWRLRNSVQGGKARHFNSK